MGRFHNFLTSWCSKHTVGFNIVAFIAGFSAFFCGWAYRKPYLAATYEGRFMWNVPFKIILITFEVIGYALSKFYGIKFIPELNQAMKGIWIIVFCLAAEFFLILFGAVPFPYNSILMIFDGACLGQLWGLVFSFLEGRRTSEILAAGMGFAVIVSVGALKSVAQVFLNAGVNLFWVPSIVGGIFILPLLISVFVLESLPEPNEKDIASRTERVVMDGASRWRFFITFAPGIVINTLFYMLVSAYRDFRDNFSTELFAAYGITNEASIFTISEIIVAVIVLIPIGLFMLIKLGIWSLLSYHFLILFGMAGLIMLTALLEAKKISGIFFMVASGVCIYLGYMPFNSIIWDVVIALFKYKANNGLLMYIIDSFGYVTSVVLLFIKNFGTVNMTWEAFYNIASYVMGASGIALTILSMIYYTLKMKNWNKNAAESNLEEIERKQGGDEFGVDSSSEEAIIL